MKRLAGIPTTALLLVTVLAAPTVAETRAPSLASAVESIDPGKVRVQFKVRVLGLLSIKGRFDRLFGKFVNSSKGRAAGGGCVSAPGVPSPGASANSAIALLKNTPLTISSSIQSQRFFQTSSNML